MGRHLLGASSIFVQRKLLPLFWCTCFFVLAMNVSVGFRPDITTLLLLLTLFYYHRRNKLNLMIFCLVGEKPNKGLPGIVGARGDTV